MSHKHSIYNLIWQGEIIDFLIKVCYSEVRNKSTINSLKLNKMIETIDVFVICIHTFTVLIVFHFFFTLFSSERDKWYQYIKQMVVLMSALILVCLLANSQQQRNEKLFIIKIERK